MSPAKLREAEEIASTCYQTRRVAPPPTDEVAKRQAALIAKVRAKERAVKGGAPWER